jgi:hypothetical protein
MATFYWLGVTGASGNVNDVVNWTNWAPFGLCGFLPTHANRIPQDGEPIIFTKYSVLGACYGIETYPIVAPQGPMLGYSGGIQYFSSVVVNPDCPVPLGASGSYFRFRTASLALNVGVGACGAPAGSASYIDLVDGSGVTRANAIISVAARKTHTYWIKGTVRTISTNPVSPYSTYATVHLQNLELGSAFQYTINNNPYGNSGLRNYDVFHVYSTTSGYNGIMSGGSDTGIVVHRGYASGLDISVIYLAPHNLGGPTLTFEEDTGFEGASGPDALSRTYVEKLTTFGGGSIQQPNIVVKHGVDINNLQMYSGKVSFAQYPTADATSVQEGFMYAENASLEILHPGTVSLGTNGSFNLISTGASAYSPNISLNGNWTMDLTPAGVCGL